MRYMLLINIDRAAPPRQKGRAGGRSSRATSASEAELKAAGKIESTPSACARMRRASRVRLKAGQRLVTDGPFAETKELVGGFYVIECDTKDEAIEWAKKILLRDDRTVEVRPIWRGDPLAMERAPPGACAPRLGAQPCASKSTAVVTPPPAAPEMADTPGAPEILNRLEHPQEIGQLRNA